MRLEQDNLADAETDSLIHEFLVESYENLDQLDRDFVELERDPANVDVLSRIFRTIHTIKGTSGFLAFSKLEALTHKGENLLAKLRDGALQLDAGMTSVLLAMVDAVRQILAAIEENWSEGDVDYGVLTRQLAALQEPRAAAVAPVSMASAAPAEATAAVPPAPGDSRNAAADTTIRVDVGLLDRLMTLVGELVLARNQILQLNAPQADTGFVATAQRLNLVTSELQESVMKTRMQPVGNVWSKFPRVVRDLAQTCGKQVQVEMEGKETELDKTILEAIKDPLTHLVRNSVDHGIEAPEARTGRGKPAQGTLTLSAFHQGGQVIIEISDDGGGIDVERVRRKAIDRGVVPADQAARMSDGEALKLIFLPGFSTAEKVTNVSGRGVGLDVVKTNVEKLGGTIDVQARPGEGSTFRLKIPLTLAIVPTLIVTCAGDRYAIPQVSLLELVRLDGQSAGSRVESIHGTPVYRLRGDLLPLVSLRALLGLGAPSWEAAGEQESVNIVVLQADGLPFGLVVDGVQDSEEIVVKPLGRQLKGLPVYAGATILGDGSVALILDVVGIAQRGHVLAESRERALASAEAEAAAGSAGELQTLLVFRTAGDGRMAVPLSRVARLEEFPAAQIERVGDAEVIQYRDDLLPLVRLSHLLCERAPAARELATGEQGAREVVHVVVHSAEGRRVGLIVDRILDIVDERLHLTHVAARAGVEGTAVIRGRTTEILSCEAVLAFAAAQRSAPPASVAVEM